jgi:hypothetical protein
MKPPRQTAVPVHFTNFTTEEQNYFKKNIEI